MITSSPTGAAQQGSPLTEFMGKLTEEKEEKLATLKVDNAAAHNAARVVRHYSTLKAAPTSASSNKLERVKTLTPKWPDSKEMGTGRWAETSGRDVNADAPLAMPDRGKAKKDSAPVMPRRR